MTLKIDKKIVGYEVVDISQSQEQAAVETKQLVVETKELEVEKKVESATIVQMHEKLQ
ncbi:MAG: hypothetical protein HOH29_03105, partial [Cellvibrionales bacterium]|nr:hypothetical protein [Cellvibrionales bacterium]